MSDLLKQYNELTLQIMDAQAKLADVKAAIEAEVKANGTMQAHGVKAYYKPGRKSTDHEAALTAYRHQLRANADMETMAYMDSLILENTKIKETVAWANVTKKLRNVKLGDFTTESAPSFVIEVAS